MSSSKTKQQSVDRALVLGVLAFRSRFEGLRIKNAAGIERATAVEMAAGVTEWLREAELWTSAFDEEREVFERPPLSWPRDVTIAVQSAGIEESVGTLLFCLGVLDRIPAYDKRFDAELVLHRPPFLSDSPFVTRKGMPPSEEYASMIRSVELRRRVRIEAEERRAGLYWWRARSHSLVHAGHLDLRELESILLQGAAQSLALGIPVDKRGEFLVRGGRYADLHESDFAVCSVLAESRLRALRWLLSDSAWMDVDRSS